ncbi:hypothetical protein R1sor_005535 [Riccia sorocarpa]|uniref:Reverse transcriptase zinc-binding domain-containing protein n=1 Tax=Riccia sorocarpa TaxID=122646 RepID=A0ABD3HNC6_9MARC
MPFISLARSLRGLVVLRYLLQVKLPFSLALVRLRAADLKALERLLASFLWGQGPDGRNKIVLVSWDKLALPLELGGTGVWCIRVFQKSLLAKLLEVYLLFREEQAFIILPSLFLRWSLDSTLQDWLALFGKLRAAGAHRRDNLFLWRILFKGFFMGARASLIGVSSADCKFCNLHMEDITHLFLLCPCKARDWMILASTFLFLRPLILMLLAGEPFPSVLRSALFFPKGLWLFTVVLLSSFLRTIWKQRCTYVYEDSFQVIPLQPTLALLGEKLLGQYIVAGRTRRRILAVALRKALEAHWLLPKSLETRIRTVLG